MEDIGRLQRALQRAQAAGDAEAVADLQQRLQAAQRPAPMPTLGQPQAAPPRPSQAPPEAPIVPGGGQPFVRAARGGAFGAGLADAGIRAALGIKSLFTDLSPENKAVLREMEAESKADPSKFLRGSGELAANVALSAIPATKAAKMAAATRYGAVNPLKASIAAAAGASGAQEFALAPVETQGAAGRLGNKLYEGITAAGAGALGQGVLGGAAKVATQMFTPKADAVALFKQGVNPTLGEAAEGRIGQAVGGLAAGRKSIGRQQDELANSLLRDVTDGQREFPGGTGGHLYREAKDYVTGLYDDATKGHRAVIGGKLREKLAADVAQVHPTGRGRGEAAEAFRIWNERLGEGVRHPTTNAIMPEVKNFSTMREEVFAPLGKEIYSTNLPDGVRNRLSAARRELIDTLRSRLPQENQAALKAADIKQFDVARIREATKGSGLEKEGINPKRLLEAYSNKADEARSLGNHTLETLVGPAGRVLGDSQSRAQAIAEYTTLRRMTPGLWGAGGLALGGLASGAGVGLAPLAALPYIVSAVGQTGRGAKFLTGQYGWQQKYADALRELAAAGATGTATNMTDQEQ